MSASILSEKLDALESTGANVLVTGNPGCLLQWRQGVKQRGLDIEVIHLATLLMRTVIVADR
jgi:glycolate oxidase iron-sulfur subunit